MAFAAGLFEKAVGAIACVAFAAFASTAAAEWAGRRYGRDSERAVALLTFLVVLIVLGFAAARFL